MKCANVTAVICARYSSDNQREESIEGQIRECTAYAEKNGITVVKHYIDRAISAKTDNRPQFQQMIKDSERKLRSRLGLLLVAEREHLWPGAAETDAALAAWDEKRDGQRTFPANDARKARQRLASARAEGFILARSTLIPPPEEPVVEG